MIFWFIQRAKKTLSTLKCERQGLCMAPTYPLSHSIFGAHWIGDGMSWLDQEKVCASCGGLGNATQGAGITTDRKERRRMIT